MEQIEIGELRDDEMLIRITGVGVCHTDLICRDQVYPVPLPVVLGHEGSGIVEQVGKAVTRFAPGDAVVLSYRSCGNCINCKRGEPAHCLEIFQRNFGGGREDGTTPISQNGQPVHGCFFSQSSFSEYAIAHESNAVKVPSDVNVPLELLGPLGCGIQSGAGAVINSLNPRVASSLVVFGCGSVGVAAVIAARLVGCRTIIAVDPKRERRELAMELGATHSLDPVDTDPVANIQEITIYGADYSLECTGLPHVFRHSVDCLAVNGTCGLIGAAPPGTEVTFDMNSIMFGRKVMGIIEGDSVPDVFIPELIHLFDQGLFPLDKLITTYPLDEIERAVADMESGKVLKPVLIP
ncbi:MAG: NAD(P)-dependent alcohol dehydrogenase [Candidatus Thiodiazotropha sp.]